MRISLEKLHKISKRKGTTLLETVVYVTLLSILTTLTVVGLLTLNNSIQGIVLGRIMDDAAQEVMEKIIREIRFADNVNTLESSLGVNPSVLVLNSTTVGGTPVEVEFSISGDTLQLKRDGTVVGPLTAQKISINEIIFDHISTPVSEAVKVGLVLEGIRPGINLEESYSTTVILRGSY